MTEQKTNESEEEEAEVEAPKAAEKGAETGNQYKTFGIIREANKAREGLAAEREASEKILAELRELRAIDAMGGGTESTPIPKKDEESPQDYAKKVLEGKV